MWRCTCHARSHRGASVISRRIDRFANTRSLLSSSRFEQRKTIFLRARSAREFERRHRSALQTANFCNSGSSSGSGIVNTRVTAEQVNVLRPRVHSLKGSNGVAHNLASVRAPPLLGSSFGQEFQRRQFNTQRGFPPRRGFPQRVFAGAVFLFLAAWGLLFGAITLLLLPFIGLALYLLRRDFQRGGPSRGLAESVARRMAERADRGFPPGAVGGPMAHWMQRAPTEGLLSTVLSQTLGGGIRGMQLVGVLRSEVKNRARRHPGLTSALGGDIEAFSDVEMSTVGTAGGSFGRQSAPAGGSIAGGQGPSRVIKARLRFMGRRSGAGGAGWAEVEVSDWEGQNDKDDTEGLEFDRIVVTLDNGKTFDLSNLDGEHHGRGNGSGDTINSTFTSRGPTGNWKQTGGKDRQADRRRPKDKRRPVEAEFRDK
ncbi:unnamed protein product [Ascophyllum nodosum]